MPNAISFSLFSNLHSTSNGGGLFINKPLSISKIHHCMFYNCSAAAAGGGLYISHCSIAIKYCCFNQCKSQYYVAISYIGTNDENVFKFISTDSCSTIETSEVGQGATMHFQELKITKVNNINSTNNVLNHIATAEASYCNESEFIFINSIQNNSPKEGVIVQLHISNINTIKYSNFISNKCGNLPLLRSFNGDNDPLTVTVSCCNFIGNQCNAIVTPSITVISCYDDKTSTFGANILTPLQSPLDNPISIVLCIYSKTGSFINFPHNLFYYFTYIFLVKY